jgi:excinuclease UvrABC nuclease subunit
VADAIGSAESDDVKKLVRDVDGAPEQLIARLEAEMLAAARALEFERAASLRDRIEDVRATLVMAGQMGVGAPAERARRGGADANEPRRIKRRFGRDR